MDSEIGEIVVKRNPKEDGLWISDRELQVIQGIIAGKTSKEIAADHGVSCKTVESQRLNVINRLGCPNMYKVVAVLFRQKILT